MMARERVEAKDAHAFGVFQKLLRTNIHVRSFFFFLMLAMVGIFLQDAILEVFGAEVFHMTQKQTASFTQYWGGGMLIGIALVAIFVRLKPVSRRTMATVGGSGITVCLMLLVCAAGFSYAPLVAPALFLMGLWTGLFNVGALSLMMDMTIEGHTGIYMGMWGLAQGFGIGLANVLSGVLHTALIKTALFPPASAYALIYFLEACVMVCAIALLRHLDVQDFKALRHEDMQAAIMLDSGA